MKMKFILLLNFVVLVNDVFGAIPRIDPLVRTPQGLVLGQRAHDGDYSYFLGVPYATVDLDNPFGPAIPHEKYDEEIFIAYNGDTRCPQTNIQPFAPKAASNEETLDCLRMNIYVPNEANTRNPFPVLIWIHGGAFAAGYAGQYNPRDLVRQGIIVVTINYRLGPYGFMCLDVPAVTGNQGLKDQHEALRWVRSNIGSFGGNPYNVTLAGQSAGSSSALLHLYSSKDKLYHKVIAESGTPQNEGMFVNGDVDAAIKLAQHLGFDTTDTEQALSFLAQASPDLVVAAARDIYLVLRPCRERSFSGVDNFIESDPFALTNERKIRNTPILIGHTSKEHAGASSMYGDNYFKIDPFYNKIQDNFNLDDVQTAATATIIRHFYIGDQPISKDLTSKLEEFDSDFVFNHPMRRTITNLLEENASPLYEYLFSYTEDPDADGASHSAELGHLFQMSNFAPADTEQNQLITNRITTLWANFVKYGNPTPQVSDLLPVTWRASTGDNRPYMVIDTDMRMDSRVYTDRMSFWDLFYSVYARSHNLARECSIQTS